MSTLRVVKITNLNDDGAVEFTKGATLPTGQSIVDADGSNAIQVSTASGVVTATQFVGDGSGITGLSGTQTGVAIGLMFIGA